ncbi:MAG: hypothetical protein IJ876_05175 [Elusimicrobiaceae bacterium]|nr:hypothetical protein [Elusimicrobiaceae bacterium]
MSKTSYALIGIMVAALIYMGAARLYEKWERQLEARQAASLVDGEPFSFQHVPLSLAAPQAEAMQTPIKYQRPLPEIYFEDTPLSEQQKDQQAQETLASIVDDFKTDPAVAHFNQDLQDATQGNMQNLADLSSQNMAQFIKQNPEIMRVVQKHMNNKDFAAKINEIFSNPQFQQSVRQLQGPSTGSTVPAQRRP